MICISITNRYYSKHTYIVKEENKSTWRSVIMPQRLLISTDGAHSDACVKKSVFVLESRGAAILFNFDRHYSFWPPVDIGLIWQYGIYLLLLKTYYIEIE